jgi:hypothetical protein
MANFHTFGIHSKNPKMKNSLVLLFLLSCVSLSFGQALVNPSFETWTSFVASGGVGEYPTGWTTTDSITKANGGVQSAWKGTDFYDGNYCLHLKTSQITYLGFPITGPAIATNGKVNLVGASFVFTEGSADTNRARYYSGRYKYTPAASTDSGLVSVFFLKRNGANRDTIATGYTSLEPSATYRQFMVMMYFRVWTDQPDTSLILIQSSKGTINGATVALGSELVVDSLNATGFVGIEELEGDVKSFTVYPSPASSFITLDAELRNQTALSYDIFDQSGRWIRSGKMNTAKESIEISDLAVGNYIVKLNSNGKTVTAKQFAVAR